MVQSQDRRIRVMRIIARMNIGGPAVQVSGLMRGLNATEFEHRLVTGYCAQDEADYLDTVATDITATRIKGLGRSISPLADLSSFVQIVKEIRTFRPDIIHTHTAKAGVVGRLASLVSGHQSIRVHTFHGHLLHGYFGSIKTHLVVVTERLLALFTTHLLAVGKKVMDDLLTVGIGTSSKFSIMPPGLELRSLPLRISACHELGLDPSKTYCAFIGRITQIKRPDRFLDVVSELKKRGSKMQFIVAGAGDLLDYCSDRVEKESLPVTFLGWREDIETVLAASNLLLLTSDNEGTPLSLIQAGMANLPIVATFVGSIPEIVVDASTGLLTDLSVPALVEAVEKLALNPRMRETMGEAAHQYTITRYGVERLVVDHQVLYRKLLQR